MIPLLYVLVVSAAAFVQGTVGFAFALLTVPLLSLVVTPGAATALGATLGTVVVITGAILHRDEIQWGGMLALTVVAVAFLPVGALFVARAPEPIVISLLGLVALSVGLDSLQRLWRSRRRAAHAGSSPESHLPDTKHSRQKRRQGLLGTAAAALSGAFGGAFATPGPPMVAYLYATTSDRRLAKANLQAFFILISLLTVATQVVVGNLTTDLLPFALLTAPPVALSTALGVYVSRRLNTMRLRLATDLALVGLGIALIIRAAG